MSGRKSRTKGHGYEREIAKKFREFFPDARRKLEYQAMVIDGTDIEECGPFAIQCKRYKKYVSLSKIEEITAKGKINLLVTKGDHKPDLVAMKLEDFFKILRDIGEAYASD